MALVVLQSVEHRAGAVGDDLESSQMPCAPVASVVVVGKSVNTGMAWAAHSVEHEAGTMARVVSGAPGATVRGSPMAGTGAAGSASPADVRARSAVSELATAEVTQGAGTAALVSMDTAGVTTSGVVVAGVGDGGSARPVSDWRISALHSSR